MGVECGCAPQARFDPLRIRPYVSLPDPGQGEGPPPAQPVRGAVTPSRPASGTGQADTPAFGIPPVAPTHPAWPDETVPLRPVPPTPASAPAPAPAPDGQSTPAPRRRRPLLPLLLGAAAVVVLGSGAALAMGAFGDSGESGAALSDAKPSAPAVNAAPAAPSTASQSPTRSPSPSASASRSTSPSPSPSASRSSSPSPSASASRSSAPPSPSASASRAPSSQAPKPAPAQSLQYGDSGAEVEQLQRLLASARLYRGKFNGMYDDRTENAVSEFQWRHQIVEDPWGVYGPATRKALEG
ncbi:peptidoglycan-binding domain-containing protein [Streptomyces goshikiensis]|uniref:peptidoglycan-binding domain-containing protein n=1 Tax=Streptomyces goshikiensis TaxID=1942 RepID=UPI00369E852D